MSFSIKNVGSFASDEVPQVYLGPPAEQPKDEQFAIRSLAAFDRIHLDAGQSRTVQLHISLHCLQYWSVSSGRWVTGAGSRTVFVGPSSRDLPLHETIQG